MNKQHETAKEYIKNGGNPKNLPETVRAAIQVQVPEHLTPEDKHEIDEMLNEPEGEREEVKYMTKDLKDRAIKVQGGKEYVLVADRILFFNEAYPNGRISTQLLSDPDSDKIAFKALVMPDAETPGRYFTGHSQAVVGVGMVNKTAAMENAETSAIGRALGMMGIGVIDSIASADEMAKAGAFENERIIREPIDEPIDEPVQANHVTDGERLCGVHNVVLSRAVSKKTNKPYFYHRSETEGMCFGKGYK